MKQVIEIEVPDGKKAVWENGRIEFIPEKNWKDIKTFDSAMNYLVKTNQCKSLLDEYRNSIPGSYSNILCKYRIVVAALTNNEKRHLTTGDKWYPVVQFCRPKDKNNCWGNVLIGTIESEGARYSVVGGFATGGVSAGLGYFHSYGGVSGAWAHIGFRSVSSKEIAEHISKYFGKLLFEVQYGGVNCNWEWVS